MTTKYNITLNQGAEFRSSFDMFDDDGNPLDLSVYTGASQMRKHYTSANSVTFDVLLSDVGVVVLSLPTANTVDIIPGRYMYDVEITDSSNATFRIISGIVTVTPNITRG